MVSRWHQVPGLVARRDPAVPLLIEPEQCPSTDETGARCVGIRGHDARGTNGGHGYAAVEPVAP